MSRRRFQVRVREVPEGSDFMSAKRPNLPPLPATWDLYETTRHLDCVKVDTLAIANGGAEFDLPYEGIFTLVGTIKK